MTDAPIKWITHFFLKDMRDKKTAGDKVTELKKLKHADESTSKGSTCMCVTYNKDTRVN